MVAMQIWSVQTALLLRSCRGHDGEVTDLAINLDSTMVASSSNDTTIRCWSLEACTLLIKPRFVQFRSKQKVVQA